MNEPFEKVLILVEPAEGEVREVAIGSVAVVIGRDESADIRLDDRKLSRRHASFRIADGQVWVEDLKSVNGVRLNGRKIAKKAAVLFGDVVDVGGVQIRLKSAPSFEAAPRASTQALRDFSVAAPDPAALTPASTPPPLVLTGVKKPIKGQKFALAMNEHLIGRADECSVAVVDASVSRQHARIVVAPSGATVTDLDSSNGTFINHIRIDSAMLKNQDVLDVGSVRFKVALSSSIAERNGPVPRSKATPPGGTKPGISASAWLAAGIVLVGAVVVIGILRISSSDVADDGSPPALEAATPGGAVDGTLAAPRPTNTPTDARADETREQPSMVVALTPARTSTSPYSRRGKDGEILDVPPVDLAFDVEGAIARKLAEATASLEAGHLDAAAKTVEELLFHDPLHAEGVGLRRAIAKSRDARTLLAKADRLANEGMVLDAIGVLRQLPNDVPETEHAHAREKKLVSKFAAQELERARREANDTATQVTAYARLVEILSVDPNHSEAQAAIEALALKLRASNVPFSAYTPKAVRPRGVAAEDASPNDALIARYPNRAARKVVLDYAAGNLTDAIRGAALLVKTQAGAQRKDVAELHVGLMKIEEKHSRVRKEVANDPAQAWAHLIELRRLERELILPEPMRSRLVVEAESTLARAFGQRGNTAFEEQRYELAFQQWDAGSKLNPEEPIVLAGLKKLEEIAQKAADEAELASQRGVPDVCDRWRRITRMTGANTEPHRRARQHLEQGC